MGVLGIAVGVLGFRFCRQKQWKPMEDRDEVVRLPRGEATSANPDYDNLIS